ncbi:MAG: gliding motility-associated C-terminal domain-containing protein [Bacteroidetes bacterium]|nr:MAG: gliding motility-associated C-terminal domain-containing protein [Bacteroidota bacterium]
MKKSKTTEHFATICLCLLAFFWGISGLFAHSMTPPPAKGKEKLIVVKNNKLIFDPYEHVGENTRILHIGVATQPKFGTLNFRNDNTIVYQPNQDLCEETDEFAYFIETAQGTETYEVNVEILCESLTILSGFSPDSDDDYNTFTILGIQNYPNNTLLIFNKWGEQVYSAKGYQNDWKGTEKERPTTADEGVYYYVFNDGQGHSYSGYVQVLAGS